MTKNTKLTEKFIYIAWLVAIIGTITSLYFSEIKRLTPCELCWYQRIIMYPLVFIIATGIIRKKIAEIPYYVLPFSISGILLALYHTLLQQEVITKTGSCTTGIACSAIQLELFGFLTIPMMSLLGFLLITIMMLLALKGEKNGR